MTQDTVQQLPAQTIKLITSSQIVTSVGTAVKELIENSIDAGAKVIQVRLENYGLDLIEVKDDGSGVSYDNVQKMFLPGYTSKIKQFEDLDKLCSYGFRGEALAAICKLANVSITTKTKLDTLAMTYEIDSTGLPVSSKPSHINNGTVITVSKLFSNLPVRRLFLSSKKKMSEELKKTEQIVQSLSLIHQELIVSLIHNKCPIWRKNSVKGIKQSFMQVAGLKTVSKMEYLNKYFHQVNVDLIVPKKNLENVDCVFSNSRQSIYVYVNKRPVDCKILSKPVQEHVFHHYSNSNITTKYAVCLVSVDVPPQQTDVNLEPNKTKILLKNHLELVKIIDELLKNYYGQENFTCSSAAAAAAADSEECENDEEAGKHPSKRQKLSDKAVGGSRIDELREKNSDWEIEIINDSPVESSLTPADLFAAESVDQGTFQPQSLCSQINSENSVLTSEEISNFNTALSETSHKLLISTNNSNCETRLIDRNDIQSRIVEKPILKEWPCRPKVVVTPQQDVPEPEVDETQKRAVEEIAEEIEKSAEEWSSEMLRAMKADGEKTILTEDVDQFDLSMQSVSSQMGKKEMKAFTKFARIMRPKICQEFPNIKFTQIAGILAERWKALTPDEVKYYEKMSDVVDINRKMHQELKQTELAKLPAEKAKKSPKKATESLKSMLDNIKKKAKMTRPPRKEISFPVSVDTIRRLREEPAPQQPSDSDFRIVGKLHPSGNWLYARGNELGHVRHQGLRELITSQKMLNSYCISRKSAEKELPVTEETLGTVLWNVLVSLETEFDCISGKEVITSDAITKNGFQVEIVKYGDVITSANITQVADSIPHFGVTELKDVLRLYHKNGEFGGLASWRPTAVCNYITNEAVRIAQESFQPPDREEIEDMMNTYHLCFRHLPPLCLHSKEIFPSFYNLQNPPPNIQESQNFDK